MRTKKIDGQVNMVESTPTSKRKEAPKLAPYVPKFARFTLIELLVVVSIVFVLIAILLPATVEVKSKAEQSFCMNNLRQIGIAAFSYSEDYDQYVMPGKFETTTVNNYNHWINYMFAELIDDASVFVCPTLNDEDNFNPAGGDNTIFEASYIMNLIRPGNWAGADIGSDPDKSRGWGTTTEYIRIQEVRDPSTKIHIMDVAEGGIHYNHSGIGKFSETDHGIIKIPPTAGFRRVGFHHPSGFNVLMGDNHIESMKWTEHNQWVVVVK